MSDAPVATRARTPGRIDLDALPPWRTALGLAAGLLVLYAALEVAAGRLGALAPELAELLEREIAIGVVMVLLVSYAAGAWLSLRAATRRHVEALGPQLGLAGAPLRELAVQAFTPGPVSRRFSPVVGIALVVGLASRTNPNGFADWLEPGYWILETYWSWAGMLAVGWMVGRITTTAVHASLTFRTLASRVGSVDLLDPSPLAPFVRQGMHVALLWLGFVAIIALNLVNQDFGTVVAIALLFAILISTLSLFFPLSGIRERLRDAKATELAAVRSEIRRAREGLGTDAVTRLPGLLAYEQRVLGTSEWLLDAPTIVRFLLYLAIPLASWVGGAFAERAVSAVLD